MKVRKVKLRGFLTYKDEIEIDFTRLFDKKIFLISGPTGSGKTTIFDAISFALYGEVPREIAMEDLRSDFLSEDDTFTYVDLEFALGDKIYEVLRVPSQRAVEIKNPKNIGHRVELYDITGEKVLLAEKIKEVDDKIKELIGLDKDQFTKVMLLAQGQFQKFLNSKSDEKAALLSNIFKTDAQRAIQDELKTRAMDKKKKLNQIDKDLENVISFNDILKEKIDKDLILKRDFIAIFDIISEIEKNQDSFLGEILKSLENLEKREKSLIQDLEKGKSLNENIEKFKKADLSYQNLLLDLEKNTKVKEDLAFITFAKSIKIYEDRLEKTKIDLKEFLASKGKYEKSLEDKNKILEELGEEIKNLPEVKAKLDKVKISYSQKLKEISDFEEFLAVKKSYESIKDLDKDFESLQTKIKEDETELEKLRLSYDRTNEKLNEVKDEGFSKREKIAEIRSKIEKLNEDYNKLRENKSNEERLENISKDLKAQERLKEKADLDRDHFEINKLIDRLNSEGICPVCGKIHQGVKEKLQVSALDLEKITGDLADLRIKLEKTKAIYDKNLKDLQTDFKLKDLEKIISDNKDLLESYEDLAREKKKQLDELAKLLKTIGKKGQDLKKAKEDKEKTIKEISDKLKNLNDLKVKYLAGEKLMLGLNMEKLLNEKKDFEEEISKLDSFIRKKEKAHQDLVVETSKLKSIINSLDSNLGKANEDLKKYQKEFEAKLAEKFNTIDDYRSYLSREDELKDKKEFIDVYFKNLDREKTTRENFLDFKNQKPINLDEFEQNLEEIGREIKVLDGEKIAAATRLDLTKKDGEKIRKIKEIYQGLSKTAQIVSALSDLANGVTGAVKGIERLDFETFILSVYFDRVLNFANKRFNQMTDGQFSMVRKTEATDGRSKMGLDIEILDSNTGKKRPASTLSGGENFLASLSLALGLSDEIGAENGGIRIDTLFIDEGFGTLSKEFLSNAIATIEKLSMEDRFVGLISHVDELKDAIEAKIIITYDSSSGSSLEIIDD
ncbi:AAA family ATPase [uncultured Anaerococcus sp.]|uniref:AAA family ATPase n=1 Tax=uncultured Anaerococcus sp. TaxID=293428 RepID=UPI00288972F5|nr:AAA family ATPase [uncultured Anaerococcus sp.]